jgi:ribonuclease P protein component
VSLPADPPKRERFTPQQRLRSAQAFNYVFAASLRSSDQYFTILARANGTGQPRLGLAISKRAAKRAVSRNRLKRLARESFRQRSADGGLDFIVMAKPPAVTAEQALLRVSLERHFCRLEDKVRA